jgi:hypothetical protein
MWLTVKKALKILREKREVIWSFSFFQTVYTILIKSSKTMPVPCLACAPI